jgi:hypothetical protein
METAIELVHNWEIATGQLGLNYSWQRSSRVPVDSWQNAGSDNWAADSWQRTNKELADNGRTACILMENLW